METVNFSVFTLFFADDANKNSSLWLLKFPCPGTNEHFVAF